MNSMGPIIAASAAAAAARRLAEEEEQMAIYTTDDLQNDWEFKIVRGNQEAFRNQAVFTKLVNEEKQAGWVLLEKFDNSRVRFKRPRAMQAHDEQLISQGIDPYRTQYGTFLARNTMMLASLAIAMLFVALGIYFMFAFRMNP